MNSVIVWVLVIRLSGAFCMEMPTIKFSTEQECERAKIGIDDIHLKSATCEPRKASK